MSQSKLERLYAATMPERHDVIAFPAVQRTPILLWFILRSHSAAGDGYFESMNDKGSWQRMTDGLEHQYRWSVAVGSRDPATLLLTASKSAYGAHYKESACLFRLPPFWNNA